MTIIGVLLLCNLSAKILLTSSFSLPFQIQIHKNLNGYRHPFITKSQTCQQKSILSHDSTIPITTRSSTSIFSIKQLMDDLSSVDKSKDESSRVVFVGGKGGVGKTSISSALAVELASTYDLKVLIVSTDPAHSLGDALDVDLNTQGKVVTMSDPLTNGNLNAYEIDPMVALDEFKSNLEAFDVGKLSKLLGVSESFLDNLGLREFSGLLQNPPPGLDELIALANVLDPTSDLLDGGNKYDVIIVDTAPTGHTLRLLSLPKFLDGLLRKLLVLRKSLLGLTSTFQSLLGSNTDEINSQRQVMDDALSKLEKFQIKISSMEKQLQNPDLTNFLIVTIPTKLSTLESKRLYHELRQQSIQVSDIVVNQCLTVYDGDDDENDASSTIKYYQRRRSNQDKWINELKQTTNEISQTSEYRSNDVNNSGDIQVTTVPFYNVELVSIPALSFLANECYLKDSSFDYLMTTNGDEKSKFIICGGKGGVGKTTTSSALAVAMATSGQNVAVISTDPAHSLGDALDMDLSSGSLVDCSPFLPSIQGEGSLSALEINPAKAIAQFKKLVDNLTGLSSSTSSTEKGNGNGETMNAIRDLSQIFDTLPAGADEVIALAQIVSLLKKEKFTRIVLDTAPTGHTLRMLSTPSFLAELIDQVLAISKKINSNSMVKMLVNSGIANSGMAGKKTSAADIETISEQAEAKLLSFQMQMYDLEDIFSNAEQTEFLVVTIPTELAVRETIRLVNDLTFEAPDMPIKVRNVVVNQVLPGDDEDDGSAIQGFVEQVRNGQVSSMKTLENIMLNNEVEITQAAYLDTEPRGVFGLKVLASELIGE